MKALPQMILTRKQNGEGGHMPGAPLLQRLKTFAYLSILLLVATASTADAQTIFFTEDFEDTLLTSRGWFDNDRMRFSTTEHIPGSSRSLEFRFLQGARTGESGGAIRRNFTGSAEVYFSYHVRYSDNWTGSNRPYHPHEFNLLTDVDHRYIGPAATHLTFYIEQNEGRPLLAIQDALNIDESRIGIDLSQVTENRAVAGCNGSSDRHGVGDCYLSGTTHRNGKLWKAPIVGFSDTPGRYYKGDWHRVEVYVRLNSIVDGKGIADGIIRYWLDGELLIDHDDVMLRTAQHPTMKFNELLIAPYIGDGSPVEQTMWVDDLMLASGRIEVPTGVDGEEREMNGGPDLSSALDTCRVGGIRGCVTGRP